MTIKSDKWILEQCKNNNLLYPYESTSIKLDRDGNKLISYGLSSYGYDIRCSDEFQIFTNARCVPYIDPKYQNDNTFVTQQGNEFCIIPPNSFVLTRSLEYIKMPRNVTGICMGKSTYARCGIIANITPLEAGWEGHLTIELSNTTPLPAKIYANEGICQILFFESDEECNTSYADRGGKYNGQRGITNAKV